MTIHLSPSLLARNPHLVATHQASKPKRKNSRPKATPIDIPEGAVVVGVDPGYGDFGWAAVLRLPKGQRHLDHGSGSTQPSDGDPLQRALKVAEMFSAALVSLRVHGPLFVVIERWHDWRSGGKASPIESHNLGVAIGAFALAARREGAIVAFGGGSASWRARLGLASNSSKAEAHRRAALFLRLAAPPSVEHAADALCVALSAAISKTTG